MTELTGAHLVGSVPLADAESVFRTVAKELGPFLARIPDGETGNRHRWIWWQREMLLNHPAMELDPGPRATQRWHRDIDVPAGGWAYAEQRGAGPDQNRKAIEQRHDEGRAGKNNRNGGG